MSFNLASAYVQLESRGFTGVMGGIAQVNAGLHSLGPTTAGITGGMSSRLASLAPILGTVAVGVAGIGAAAVGTAKSLMAMVDMAVDLEQVETRFRTLLGSAEAAKMMVEDLSKFAASTPFQMEGLTQTAQTLLAFGVSADQVIPTMKALGDVAAASGADINELGNIYGKVRANGRLMTESLDQFNERAIPVGASLAKLFGKTEADIRKMASNGEISFGDLQKAMVQMTSEGGMAFGGMDQQSKTLGGLWSTLSDNITLAMTDVGVALVEGFDLKGVTATIIGFTDRVRGEWLPSIVSGFRWLSNSIVQPMVVGFTQIADATADFVGSFDLYWKVASLSVTNFALNSAERFRVMSVNMVEMGVWAVNNWQNLLMDLGNAHLTVFQNIGENLRSMWQGVLDFIAGRGFNVDFTPLLQGFESTITQMPQLSQGAFDKLKPQIDQVYAQIRQRQDEAAAARAAESGSIAAPTSLAIEEGGGMAGDKGGGKDKASFVGLAQLAEQMQAQAGARQDMQRQVAAAEAAARANERVAAKAEGDGLRVNVVGMNVGSGPPAVAFEFGT